MKKKRVLGLMMALIAFGTSTTTLMASDNMPLAGYEVKFMVDSSQLVNEDGTLNDQAKETFNIISNPTSMLVTYLDTNEKVFKQNGWSNRLRKKDGKKNYEIQYKKRYKVENENITQALDAAKLDGFDINDVAYEAEVDWGFEKMILSIATETKIPTSTDLNLPIESEGIQLINDNLPQELNEYSLEMSNTRYFGPIEFQRYTGDFNGIELDIEVWPIKSEDSAGMEIITEVSFKSSDYEKTSVVRDQLKEYLTIKGILLEKDSLKTDLIMQRY